MEFDNKKYKVYTWKHPMMLHWIINPGLAFNELALGQRVPKVMLVEKDYRKSLAEKSYVPCPHCNTLHHGLKWSHQNNTAFGNWFGLYCDECGKIIPCLSNLTSLLLLAITFPIWYWFRDRWKAAWLSRQREKFSKPLNMTPPGVKWWKQGLQFGVWMFVTMSLLDFAVFKDEEFTWPRLGAKAISWAIAGLIFGLIMKAIAGRKKAGDDKQEVINHGRQ